jgi:hypothetical protein
VRREQSGERRDDVGAAVVVDAAGQRLDLVRGVDQPQVVAQPLHERTGDRDRALQGVHGWLSVQGVTHRGQQAVARHDLGRAGVEQQEVAGAIGVFGLAGLQAGLAERRGLLVAEDPRDRHARERAALAHLPVHLGRRAELRQQVDRDAHLGRDLGHPLQRVEIQQHRARGVRRVGDVHAAVRPAGQVPHQPRVDRAHRQLAALGPRASAVHVVQQPARLRAGEVRREWQADTLLVPVHAALRGKLVADRLGAGVLPHDRRGDGFAGRPVPHHGRLALVGDADRRDVGGGQFGAGQRPGQHRARVRPDLRRVVLHPARAREILPVLDLLRGDDSRVVVEDQAARGRGALVERGDDGRTA